jgi:hypothetical protein
MVAIEPPSSATLPSWAKLPTWENLPSSAKSPSLANSPLGKVVVRTRLPWQSCHWPHHQHPAGLDAVVALSSLQTLPWRSCGPPFHGRQCPPFGPPPFWSLPSAIGAHPGLCPFVIRLFQVDLLDCLGFGSHPDSHVAHLCSRWRPSFGLRLLGRPLGALDIQQGRLCFVIQNVARSLLLPVIPVPSGLVPLSGRHHSPSCACA